MKKKSLSSDKLDREHACKIQKQTLLSDEKSENSELRVDFVFPRFKMKRKLSRNLSLYRQARMKHMHKKHILQLLLLLS
jgi:hypothetical protein